MTDPFTAPVLVGSTFATANAAAPAPLSGPIRPPATQPVFDPANIELQRRMRFNPLRALDPNNLSIAHDQFDLGILRQAALLWDAMIRRDDTLSFVVPQFCNAVAGKPWGVFKKKNADPVESARHAAALEYCYANLSAVNAFDRNERGDRHLLLKQMGLCYAMKYAVHHFVWKPQPGEMIEIEVEGKTVTVPKLTAELEFVPLWFFENVSGTLRFLPFGGFGIQGQDLDWEGEWMATTGEGLMFAAASSYVFKRLGFQDWTTFNERYALPKIVGMTNAQKDSPAGAAMTEIVNAFNGDMGVVIHECQPGDKPPIALIGPEGAVSVDIFERFIDRQDKKMTVMFRGGDKRNIAGDKADSGVSAQISETEAMELAHCAAMASACRAYIDRAVIRYCFGEGVEPLAHFGLPDMDAEDAQQLRESAGFLADRGAKVELDTVAERLGVTLCEDEEDALQPAVKAAAPGDFTAEAQRTQREEKESTANAAGLARLRQLVEEALRTGNANPNHDPTGRFASYNGAYADAAAEAAEIEKGRVAMQAAITAQADQLNAMHRPGVGTIDFRWGNSGGGVRHIIEKRDREGAQRQSLAGQSGEKIAMRIPEVIAKGTLGPPYADKNGRKRNIEHEGMRAVLSLDFERGDRRVWLLSGFQRT